MEIKSHQGKLDLIVGKGSKLTLDGGVTIGETHITTPGEYELGGVSVEGLADQGGVVYHLLAEELSLAHLGGIGAPPSEKTMEAIEDVDVLILPADDTTLPAAVAQSLIASLEPKLVVLHPVKEAIVQKYFSKAESVASLKYTARELIEGTTRLVAIA